MTHDNMTPAYPQRIALIFGGMSTEHKVSIASASQVIEGLTSLAQNQALPLEVQPIYITRDGDWVWAPPAKAGAFPNREAILDAERWELRPEDFNAEIMDFPHALARLAGGDSAGGDSAGGRTGVAGPLDVALLILHGQNGEDGRLQGAFDLAGIPYTGSGAAASALAFDKPRCQAVLNAAGLPIAASTAVRAGAAGDGLGGYQRLSQVVGLPCVVKPARGGSSVGVTIVTSEDQLPTALERAWDVDDEAMVERFIKGREFTCGLLERDGELLALPITEIIPPEGRFFDYEAKYALGLSREVTPADIPPALAVKMQTLARAVHRAVGCRGFSRVDFIADPAEPTVLEVNTIPGMTATSLLPQAAAAIGIPFPDLLGLMLTSARHD